MFWERMTIDEFAMSRRADGLKVVKTDGIWWVEIRPFFFRPLFLFAEIHPWSKRYPMKSLVGGVLHGVPPGSAANSNMNLFVYDNLKNYSLDTVSHRRRRIIAQGIENFTAKKITDLDEFIDPAYEVYLSFHKRTQYSYKDERLDKQIFTGWAERLFKDPKIVKLGAYHNGKLTAIEISYYVYNVIFGDTLFADDESLSMKVTDFILHTLREEAIGTDARYFYVGLPTGVNSLDESKIIRGCKILKMPAYYQINPVALSVARVFMKSSYNKLMEITDPHLSLMLTSPRPDGAENSGPTSECHAIKGQESVEVVVVPGVPGESTSGIHSRQRLQTQAPKQSEPSEPFS